MTPEDRDVIETWGRDIKKLVRIGMASTHDPRTAQISAFCSSLNTLAPLVKIDKADPADDKTPFIRIHKQIKYKGVPQGRELIPFLNAINGRETESIQKEAPEAGIFEKIQLPALLKAYISNLCPFCPQAVSTLSLLGRSSEKIYLDVIDAEMFVDLARQDNIRSVPTVILDDQFRWTGSINIPEIIGMMISRDPATASALSIRNIIEAGNAADLAHMMAQSRKIYSNFIELLTHPKWPVRLGAMAAFEYLDEISPGLADEARFQLWERFASADDGVKGDIAYLLGGSRHPMIQSYLLSVVKGDYAEEVREAAQESLEPIPM
jgi:glutaredoxin